MLRREEEKKGKRNTDRSQRETVLSPLSLSLTHRSGTVYPVPRGAQGPSQREAKDPTRQDIFLYLCYLLSSVMTTGHHTMPTAPLPGSPFFSTVCVYSLPGRRAVSSTLTVAMLEVCSSNDKTFLPMQE